MSLDSISKVCVAKSQKKIESRDFDQSRLVTSKRISGQITVVSISVTVIALAVRVCESFGSKILYEIGFGDTIAAKTEMLPLTG